jgi:hypothetical protein
MGARTHLQVKGASIVIDTWRDKKRLAALRKVLQGGFQTHLVSNELLHQLFSFDPVEVRDVLCACWCVVCMYRRLPKAFGI